MLADCITVSRMLISLCLLILSPYSNLFAVLYLLCGIGDMLDGLVARKMHTESEKGAMLDSIADLLFAIIYAIKIMPVLSIPIWMWIWISAIAVIKVTGIIFKSRNEKKLSVQHSFANKLAGALIFLLPIAACMTDVIVCATVVCTVATVTAIIELTTSPNL